MKHKRKIEIFSAGCPQCAEAIKRSLSCQSCEITFKDIADPDSAEAAKKLGINAFPAIVVDGKIDTCCQP